MQAAESVASDQAAIGQNAKAENITIHFQTGLFDPAAYIPDADGLVI